MPDRNLIAKVIEECKWRKEPPTGPGWWWFRGSRTYMAESEVPPLP